MTHEGRAELVSEERVRADEELRAADQLLAGGLPRVAVTRAYFAVFHAIRAVLYAADLEPRSHRGALHLFNLHFVKPGRFAARTSPLVARLQKYREEADYAQVFLMDEDTARTELAAARTLVQELLASLGA